MLSDVASCAGRAGTASAPETEDVAAHRYAGADWLLAARASYARSLSRRSPFRACAERSISALGRLVADVLGEFALGLYHIPEAQLWRVDWSARDFIVVTIPDYSLATTDFPGLTRLCILTLDAGLTVAIESAGPRWARLRFMRYGCLAAGATEAAFEASRNHIALWREDVTPSQDPQRTAEYIGKNPTTLDQSAFRFLDALLAHDGVDALAGRNLRQKGAGGVFRGNPHYVEATLHDVYLNNGSFGRLTRLVVLAHDDSLRVQLSSTGPHWMRLILHPRLPGPGSTMTHHPTLDAALVAMAQARQRVREARAYYLKDALTEQGTIGDAERDAACVTATSR